MSVIKISPQDAFGLLKQNASSALVDTKTLDGFKFIVVADLSSFDVVRDLPWGCK